LLLLPPEREAGSRRFRLARIFSMSMPIDFSLKQVIVYNELLFSYTII
jgi:hypothetical protein